MQMDVPEPSWAWVVLNLFERPLVFAHLAEDNDVRRLASAELGHAFDVDAFVIQVTVLVKV